MSAIIHSMDGGVATESDQTGATWHRVDQFDVSLSDGEAVIYVSKDTERCIAVGLARKVKHVHGAKTTRLVCVDGYNQSNS